MVIFYVMNRKLLRRGKKNMEDNENACCQPVVDEDDQVSYTESEKITHLKLWEMSNTEDLLRPGEKAGVCVGHIFTLRIIGDRWTVV